MLPGCFVVESLMIDMLDLLHLSIATSGIKRFLKDSASLHASMNSKVW